MPQFFNTLHVTCGKPKLLQFSSPFHGQPNLTIIGFASRNTNKIIKIFPGKNSRINNHQSYILINSNFLLLLLLLVMVLHKSVKCIWIVPNSRNFTNSKNKSKIQKKKKGQPNFSKCISLWPFLLPHRYWERDYKKLKVNKETIKAC